VGDRVYHWLPENSKMQSSIVMKIDLLCTKFKSWDEKVNSNTDHSRVHCCVCRFCLVLVSAVILIGAIVVLLSVFYQCNNDWCSCCYSCCSTSSRIVALQYY
jgi:hypothetical protein